VLLVATLLSYHKCNDGDLIHEIQSVNSAVQINNPGEDFVDDSFLGVTPSQQHDDSLTFQENQSRHKTSVMENLTEMSQQWERLLFLTDGALNLKEKPWIIMRWKEKREGLIRSNQHSRSTPNNSWL
jgi:hypothetical protein